ncbi:methyltransferase domain-containing protein [Streptomyces longwoodensis]|uniref:class I SAM-dependent methyltransferase n=1 Tax=Streptomyces longwoodensis TaxID=68231 RepID=UPI0036E077D3
MDRHIRTVDDVLRLLDDLFAPAADRWSDRGGGWWDDFYADRSRPVPFFADKPDENLVSALDRGLVPARGRALDLGCGPGRNALYLASRGFAVDAVDLSAAAVSWARERAAGTGADVRFLCGDAFALESELPGPYDLVHDSGCFHHLPPHRRISYLALLERTLAPGGHFTLTCFAAGDGGMGSEAPDADFYVRSALDGGLAYSPESLRAIFSGLTEVELRRMREEPEDAPVFGKSFLWTAVFRREP